MSKTYNVAVIAGSLRKDSYSHKLAELLQENAPAALHFETIKIDDLPFYNEDLETAKPPAAWLRLRKAVAAADGVVFVTPEYNRSLPAALKNALDAGSRPWGHSVWNGKPALAVSHSQGAMGGYGANQHLRQVLTVLNMPAMQQPEVYIGKIQDFIGAGQQDANKKFLHSVMTAYAHWLAKHSA